jgi:hypothetical protein
VKTLTPSVKTRIRRWKDLQLAYQVKRCTADYLRTGDCPLLKDSEADRSALRTATSAPTQRLFGVIKRHGGRIIGTAEAPQKAD